MQEFLRIRHFGIARKENIYKKGTVPGGTVPFFNMLGKFVPNILKNAPLRMRTAVYKVGIASDRRRRKNVPSTFFVLK